MNFNLDIIEKVIGYFEPNLDIRSLDINELKRERKSISRLMRKITATARDDGGRDLTQHEIEAHDELDRIFDFIDDEIDRRDNQVQRPNVPIGSVDNVNEVKHAPFGINKQWRELFPNYRDTGQSPNDFLKDVIEKRTVLSGDSSGGYTVPTELWDSIYRYALMESIAMQRVRTFPMQSGTLTIPAWDSEDRSDGNPEAGLEVEWKEEGGTFTKRTPKMRAMTLAAKSAGVFVDISNPCIQDSVSLDSMLTPLMSRSVRGALDKAIISGTGVGQPQGILNAGAKISVARTTANQVAYADLAAMAARLLPGANPVWLVNPEAYAQLLQLTNSGGTDYIWIPNHAAGAASAIPGNLLGYPLILTDFVPGLGSEGDVTLVDFSFYALGLREDIRIESTIADAWTEDLISFRCIMRADGQLLLGNAVQPMNGSNTLSPVVVLE
jgi:HK97 family phage major capsid protein